MRNLIIPCAGQSSRYPGISPKYLLTHPNGGILVLEGLKGFDLNQFDKIYITILETHNEKFNASQILKNAFLKTFPSIDFNKLIVTIIKNTDNQPQTIWGTIELNNITGSIFIKDCDDYFETQIPEENGVCYYNLSKIGKTNASNKSYITTNNSGHINNIVEKRVISEEFCCGGYYFKDASEFVKYYIEISDYENLYTSHVIGAMLMDGKQFMPIQAENYIDWGTLEDWEKYKSGFKTLFVDLDGVLVENSSQFSDPEWGTTKQIQENCDLIRKLYNEGKTQIIITTARNGNFTDITIEQLKRENIPYHHIIFGLYHSKRYIINDYSNTNKYPSCEAINLERNSNKLEQYLK